jgi:protein O-mannosyl-transferase
MFESKKASVEVAPQALSGRPDSFLSRLSVPAGIILIIIVASIVYLPSINGGFILDDDIYLTNNQNIKASDGLYRFWCTAETVDYYPISNTVLWIEWRLWGMNSTGYHVTSLILHIVEVLLIWGILRKLSISGAFLAAMIFAVHPVNVESVAWIAQCKEMLAFLFFLLSILWYLKSLMRARVPLAAKQTLPTAHRPLPTSLSYILHTSSFSHWYWLSLTAFVLAMLCKGSVATLPVVLLGIIWWLRSAGTVPIIIPTKTGLSSFVSIRDLMRTMPFFVVAAVLTGVHVWFQTKGSGEAIRNAGFLERLLGAGSVVWFYFYKAILPLNLIFVYPQWNIETVNLLCWLPLLALLAVTAVLWWYRESWSRPFFFAWGFFCVVLAPVMGFVDAGFMQYSLAADHYQHIAIVGLIALASAGVSSWRQQSRGATHWAATVIAIMAVGMLAILTWRQSGLYRDAITLYQHTLERHPACWMVHNELGKALFETGRPLEAIKHYEEALTRNPDSFEAHNYFGKALFQTGRSQDAIDHFKRSIQIRPDYFNAYNNLTLAYAEMRQSSEAIGTARIALELARCMGRSTLAKQIEDWLNSYEERALKDKKQGK